MDKLLLWIFAGFIFSVYECHSQTQAIDVDECLVRDVCDHSCTNTVGSYECRCRLGYVLSTEDNKTCKDIDECQTLGLSCQHQCNNTVGSYHCYCNQGYTVDEKNQRKCLDVDECLVRDVCDHNCTNTVGSYECSCRRGYVLSTEDDKTCIDVDECASVGHGCQHKCNNTVGSYHCYCKEGYQHQEMDPRACTDVDECHLDKCRCGEHVCFNSIGSCLCKCLTGYVNDPSDDRLCVPALNGYIRQEVFYASFFLLLVCFIASVSCNVYLKRKQQQQQQKQLSASQNVSGNGKNIATNVGGSFHPKPSSEVVLMAEYEDLNIRGEPTVEETVYQQLTDDNNYESVQT